MNTLVEVAAVVQHPGEPRRRWFSSEALDLLVWMDEAGAPIGFQLGWHGHAITLRPGVPLSYTAVDEGRQAWGMAQSAILRGAVEDYDLALIEPRFAAASRQLPAPLREFVLTRLGAPAAALPQSTELAGLTVLVTRPLRQARHLVAALEGLGAQARLLPLIAIRAPADNAAALQLHQHRRAHAWLFTSVNAVAAAEKMFASRHWHAPVYAVGEATARALRNLGLDPQRPAPDAIHSEGLLALPALQAVAGQTVLIVTGEGGRDGLREPLKARGAKVEVATVYRREVVQHLAETVQATLEGVNALMLSSGESLVALHRALPPSECKRVLDLPVVLPSRRVQAMALSLGFGRPLLAATVSDEAFVQALVDWRAA